MSYFLSPSLDFNTNLRRGGGFFRLTATSGLTRGGVHLGGHCHELFFKPPIGFLPRAKGEEVRSKKSNSPP